MPSKQEIAEYLAGLHYEVQEGMVRVYRALGPGEAEDDPREPIKLLEVDEGTPAVGILPLHFGPRFSRNIPFATRIIAISPDEFERLDKDLHLPDGWEHLRAIDRPASVPVGGA